MPSRRSLSWSAAIRDMRADRVAIPVGLLAARARVDFAVRTRGPLVVAGRFDRSAIMTAAVSAAKAHQARYGSTWSESMATALKAAWQVAKAARSARAH